MPFHFFFRSAHRLIWRIPLDNSNWNQPSASSTQFTQQLTAINYSYNTTWIHQRKMPSVASEVVSACMGGMFSASALYPLEILKTRMQAEGDAGECQSLWVIFAVFFVAGASAPPIVSVIAFSINCCWSYCYISSIVLIVFFFFWPFQFHRRSFTKHPRWRREKWCKFF